VPALGTQAGCPHHHLRALHLSRGSRSMGMIGFKECQLSNISAEKSYVYSRQYC
jgi:hypothetical protein